MHPKLVTLRTKSEDVFYILLLDGLGLAYIRPSDSIILKPHLLSPLPLLLFLLKQRELLAIFSLTPHKIAATMCMASPSSLSCDCDCTTTTPTDHLHAPLLQHSSPETGKHGCKTDLQTSVVSMAAVEAKSILSIALPMVLTGLLLYSRSMVSMLFLGRLGHLPLAGGALAVAFANITGYSVLSGLAMGMEPICGQAYGAGCRHLLGLALRRTVLLLLAASLPISLLWLNIRPLLTAAGQHPAIADHARTYLLFSLPDLLSHSLLHPLRIYLRSQSLTLPLTLSSALSLLLHLPINYVLVSLLDLRLAGVALASACSNINLVLFLILYILFSGLHKQTSTPTTSTNRTGHRNGNGGGTNSSSIKGWKTLLSLAVPSCISVCLEWWWYEIMILLCGLLVNPEITVASMGILIQTTSLIYIFPSSLSFGVSTRVGNELGAGRPSAARLAAGVGVSFSFLLGLAALAFTVSVRRAWAGLFTGDEEIVGLTAAVLPIIGLCELGNCPQTTGCGVLRGTARPRAAANINMGSFYLVGMPVAVGMGFFAGFDFVGLWLGLLASQATCMVVMMVVLRRTDWVRQAERAAELTGGGGAATSLLLLEEEEEEEGEGSKCWGVKNEKLPV